MGNGVTVAQQTLTLFVLVRIQVPQPPLAFPAGRRFEPRAAESSATTEVTTVGATDSLAALCEAAVSHMRAGRHLEAQLCCEQALALDGDHADTLHLLRCLALLRIHAL